MRVKGKRSAISAGLVITAFLAAAIVYALLLYSEKKAMATEVKLKVCVAKCEVPAGTDINDVTATQYFELRDIYVSAVPENALISVGGAAGKTATYSISKGTVVTDGMFRESDLGSKWMEEPVLLGFKVDDIYQVAGGILRSGDMVHIYIIDDEGEAVLRWENVCIEDSFDSAGEILQQTQTGRATRFNIFFEKKDVEEFYTRLDSGAIRIVKL